MEERGNTATFRALETALIFNYIYYEERGAILGWWFMDG